MENCTIYYEDGKSSCRSYARVLSEYEGVTCKMASLYAEEKVIFEENKKVGFIFESGKQKIADEIRHIIGKIVMPKGGYYFLVVTGGARELTALKSAGEALSKRGYPIHVFYSRFTFEKNHLNEMEGVKKIIEDMEHIEEMDLPLKEKVEGIPKKELRKILRKDFQEYRKYRKKMIKNKNI